jgi:hypothetical protein
MFDAYFEMGKTQLKKDDPDGPLILVKSLYEKGALRQSDRIQSAKTKAT